MLDIQIEKYDQLTSDRGQIYQNTILSFFKEMVNRIPNNPAVKFDDDILTYEELDHLSDKLAANLIQLGLKNDTPVGILLPRSLEFIVSIFGILKAGGAYVPMNPNEVPERLRHIIGDLSCPFILSQSRYLNNRELLENATLLEIEIKNGDLQTLKDIPFTAQKISPQNLAYIIYTSGTTGLPKGAMIEHGNLFWLIKNYFPKLEVNDRTLQSMSLTCDASVVEIFPALCGGSTLVLYQEYRSELFEKEKITHSCITPSIAEIINPGDCTYLKKVVIGGEKLTSEVVSKFPSHVQIINGYGPTECTVACSCTPIRDVNRIHIGGKLNGAQLYVVDSSLKLCPPNSTGELLIGGDGVGRGYWKRPELTEEKFIKNPFGEGRVYRTGDLVKWNDLGDLEYIGRIDRQIKIRGYRVELDGIESIINRFPGVTGSHLIVEGQNLIGYVTPEKIDLNSLREHLQKNIPDYSLPKKFIPLKVFPLNSTGKVDSKKLPKPDFTKEHLPQTDFELSLEKLWNKALNFGVEERISLNDNFFDLGASSLSAIKLIKYLNEEYKIPLSLEYIYKNPVLKDFVSNLKNMPRRDRSFEAPLKRVFLDGLKCLPATLLFNLGFAYPVLLLVLIFFVSPILAISLVAIEFLMEKFFGPPYGNILKRLRIFFNFQSWKFSSIKIIEESPVEHSPRTIYSIGPHILVECVSLVLEEYLQSKKINFKTTYENILFKLPFSKTKFFLGGGVPAAKESYFLAEKNNFNLVVTSGDSYEAFFSDEPATLVLKSRMLFFKYALETGTSLTPVFCYNLNKSLTLFKHWHKQRLRLLERSKTLVIQPFYGRWFLPISNKMDLKIAVGKPILVEKITNPSWKDIETLYKTYVREMEGLYYRHAGENPPPLNII